MPNEDEPNQTDNNIYTLMFFGLLVTSLRSAGIRVENIPETITDGIIDITEFSAEVIKTLFLLNQLGFTLPQLIQMINPLNEGAVQRTDPITNQSELLDVLRIIQTDMDSFMSNERLKNILRSHSLTVQCPISFIDSVDEDHLNIRLLTEGGGHGIEISEASLLELIHNTSTDQVPRNPFTRGDITPENISTPNLVWFKNYVEEGLKGKGIKPQAISLILGKITEIYMSEILKKTPRKKLSRHK